MTTTKGNPDSTLEREIARLHQNSDSALARLRAMLKEALRGDGLDDFDEEESEELEEWRDQWWADPKNRKGRR